MDGREQAARMASLYAEPRNDAGIGALRVPPQAIDFEQSVLGGLMLDASSWPRVSDLLTERDFYRHDHQLIFRAIKALAEANKPHDVLTVTDFLESRGLGNEVQGGAYVFEIANGTPGASNILAYAEGVSDRSRLRQMIEVATQLVNDCFEPDGREASELVTDAAQRLAELQPAQRGGLRRASETLGGWYDRFSERYGRGTALTGIPTPWCGFNSVTHGLQPATVYLLAARPSMGKSVAALNLSSFTAIRGVTTGLFSLEMGADDCHNRNIASLAGIPHDWIIAPSGDTDHGYTDKVNSARLKLAAAPLFIDDTPSLTNRQFEARARRMHQREPLQLLVVDHIHDFAIDPKLARFEFGAILQTCKRLAKEWNIPVVALGQLNRNVTGRSDKRPTLGDLRESGELEQKADVVAFLHREDYYDSPESTTYLQGVVELHFAKGRNIRSGERVMLRNRFDEMRLEDWEGPLPQAPKVTKSSSVGYDDAPRPRGRDWGRDT